MDIHNEMERLDANCIPEPNSGCWLWLKCCNAYGYGTIVFDGSKMLAHRWSYILHNGCIPDGKWILHKCDNRLCINPAHLYAGDVIQNAKDAKERGRLYKWRGRRNGEGNPRARLSEQDVVAIRSMASSCRHEEIAQRFGISTSHVSTIVRRLSWSHVA